MECVNDRLVLSVDIIEFCVFKAAVLNSSLRAPPLCICRMLLLSLQMFVLFERKCPAKWTSGYSAMIPVRSERIYSIQSALKCARRELKLYIFTEVYDVTLVRAWRRCAAQIHEWMFRNEVNFSGFPCSGSREQWTLCREQWTPCREQWTPCREQWTPCREQWTPCREQWTQCRERWTLCREQCTLCMEQWTQCREQWTLCGEQWTLCREQWTLCREQWTLCREQWTLCREQWTLCREQWTLCREQWTLCREHVNRNTVHARSALLTSWLSESGVLTKRDMLNMQSGGGARTVIENLWFKARHIRQDFCFFMHWPVLTFWSILLL